MADNEIAVIQIEGSKFNEVLIVNEFNGEIQLCAGNESKDGRIFKTWAFPQRGDRTPAPKAIPVKVHVGDVKESIRVLRAALKCLEAHDAKNPAGSDSGYFENRKDDNWPDDGTIPF